MTHYDSPCTYDSLWLLMTLEYTSSTATFIVYIMTSVFEIIKSRYQQVVGCFSAQLTLSCEVRCDKCQYQCQELFQDWEEHSQETVILQAHHTERPAVSSLCATTSKQGTATLLFWFLLFFFFSFTFTDLWCSLSKNTDPKYSCCLYIHLRLRSSIVGRL